MGTTATIYTIYIAHVVTSHALLKFLREVDERVGEVTQKHIGPEPSDNEEVRNSVLKQSKVSPVGRVRCWHKVAPHIHLFYKVRIAS